MRTVGSCQERFWRVGGLVLGGGELGAVRAPKVGTVRRHAVHAFATKTCSWGKRVQGTACSLDFED